MLTTHISIAETETHVVVSADFEGKTPVEDKETEAVADLYVFVLRRLRSLEAELPKPLLLLSPLDRWWEEAQFRLDLRRH